MAKLKSVISGGAWGTTIFLKRNFLCGKLAPLDIVPACTGLPACPPACPPAYASSTSENLCRFLFKPTYVKSKEFQVNVP